MLADLWEDVPSHAEHTATTEQRRFELCCGRAMSAADVLGLLGSTVDPIRFDECIDASGLGAVYRGLHVGRGEPVAIKLLRLSHGWRDERQTAIVERFHDEAAKLRRLSESNHDVVRWISSGELFAPATGERLLYIVLEWLDAHTLRADLEERRRRGLTGRTFSEALDLLESAAHAIAHAHAQGVVHGSVEPKRLRLIRMRGALRLKVLDFGLAKVIEDDAPVGTGQTERTTESIRAFSPAYGAPEQLDPNIGEIGPWTDVYSFTLVLLEVMLGDRVRKVDSYASALDPRLSSPRASNVGLSLPRPIEDLLARAVAQNPLERPANVNMFWSALRELARQSLPPVSDAIALAATAYDGRVAAAMLEVRAATAAGISTSNTGPSPFTGTMVMVNAPDGALHLLSPTAKVAAEVNGPSQARSERGGDDEVPGSTAPLAKPAALPLNARVGAPNTVTTGASLASPLAASFGPGTKSPLSLEPLGSVPAAIPKTSPIGAPVAPMPGAVPPNTSSPPPPIAGQLPSWPGSPPLGPPLRNTPSVPPRVSAIEAPRGSGLIVALLVLLVVAVALGAALILLRRP